MKLLSDDGKELSATQLLRIESAMSVMASTYKKYLRYYKGDNPPIIDAVEKTKPDNRVPCPFPRKIVTTVKGYMFKAGCITYKTENDYINQLNPIFKDNNEPLITAELASDAMTNGLSFEVQRMDSEAKKIKLYRIAPGTGFPVYDDTLDRKLIAFVHQVCNEDESSGDFAKTYTRTIYYADRFVVDYKSDGEWTRLADESKEHPFGDVPVSVYSVTMDDLPIFKAVLALIDEHDKIISSNYANDMERFANAYLRMLKRLDNKNKDERGKTDLDKINEVRVFDGLNADGNTTSVTDAVDFLVKPSRGDEAAEAADRIERLIYDLAMVINPNDVKAGTAVTGIAYKMKLLPMEFLSADIEAYFSKGLQRRLMLIGNVMKSLKKIQPEEVTISWKRNIPTDLESLSVIVGNLKGVLSDETILGLFPSDLVPSVEVELERLAAMAPKLPGIIPAENPAADPKKTEEVIV